MAKQPTKIWIWLAIAGLMVPASFGQKPAEPPKAQRAPVVEEETPVAPAKPGAPVVEEEAPVRPPKPGAPVIEEEAPVRPAKPGAPVVEEEAPVKPAKPGAPVVEEEAPVKPAKPGAPVVEEEAAAPAPKQQPQVVEDNDSRSSDDTLLRAPSVVSLPRLDLRIFADAGFEAGRKKGEEFQNGFNIGLFDLFVSSKLNDKVSVLAEALFERVGNQYGFDLERAVLRYSHNRHLRFDMGRFHSNLSYYNSTFHRGSWFETTAERPYIAQWEGQEGILPSRAVGLQVSGALPSPESMPINYFFEVTNGRGFANGFSTVQSGSDTDANKATNFGLTIKPAKIAGLQIGGSVYRDRLRPGNAPDWNEKIMSFHVVYQRRNWQIINEAVHLRHQQLVGTGPAAALASPVANKAVASTGALGPLGRRSSISGAYSQVGYRIGKIVPYVRFDWVNAPASNPIARSAYGSEAGLRREVSSGFFYDLSSFSALKFQFDRLWRNGVPETHAKVQLAFAF